MQVVSLHWLVVVVAVSRAGCICVRCIRGWIWDKDCPLQLPAVTPDYSDIAACVEAAGVFELLELGDARWRDALGPGVDDSQLAGVANSYPRRQRIRFRWRRPPPGQHSGGGPAVRRLGGPWAAKRTQQLRPTTRHAMRSYSLISSPAACLPARPQMSLEVVGGSEVLPGETVTVSVTLEREEDEVRGGSSS